MSRPAGTHERTPEMRAKTSATLTGRILTAEHKAKIGNANRGRANPSAAQRMKGNQLCLGKQNNSRPIGARRDGGRGYVYVKTAEPNIWEREHRYVMSRHLGRPLTADEVVHHINGLRGDNRLVNLELYATHQEHLHLGHGWGI